jgi:anti-sigma regulatory factor (Ser/Thr protein kinase)
VSAQTGFYCIRFTADPVQLIFFRGGLDRWLQGLQWPEPDRVDAILAVSEACTNSVQHAYPVGELGEVEVVGRLVVGPAGRRIVVVVRDHGQWRAEPGGPGYGLTTVRACMERCKIRHDGQGTVVTMTSRPVPLLDSPPDGDGAPGADPGSAVSGDPSRSPGQRVRRGPVVIGG